MKQMFADIPKIEIPKDVQKQVLKCMGFADDETGIFPEERGGGAATMPVSEGNAELPKLEEKKESAEEKAEGKEIEIDQALEKLKKISEAEGVAKEVKKSAEEFMTQLEELKKLQENLDKFIAENYKEMAPAESDEAEKVPPAIA